MEGRGQSTMSAYVPILGSIVDARTCYFVKQAFPPPVRTASGSAPGFQLLPIHLARLEDAQMKRTLTTLVLLLAGASACIDPLPTDPIPELDALDGAAQPDVIGVPVVYRGQAAIDHYTKVLRSELASPRLLELNARLSGMAIAKYRARIVDDLGFLATADASSGACDNSARFTVTGTRLAIAEPLFGIGNGLWAAHSTGFSYSNKPAIHRVYTFVTGGPGIHDGLIDYTNGEENDATSTGCERAWSVGTAWFYFPADDNDCYWAHGESMHRLVKPGKDDELYSSKSVQHCWREWP